MMTLKCSKHKLVLLGLLLFAALGWSFLISILQTSYSPRFHVVNSPQQPCAETKRTETLKESSNITEITLLLKRIGKDVSKLINTSRAEKISVNPVATTKPSVDR